MKEVRIPALSLVVLIGPSGSGKSTFARRHFLPTEVLSSDFCRGLAADDENDQAATKNAFEILHFIARKRLEAGRLTIIDATNVQSEARKPLIQMAREYHVIPVAIIFDLPEKVCLKRNKLRKDRDFGPHVIGQQRSQMHRNLKSLEKEGFRHIFAFREEEEVNEAAVNRVPLWTDRRDDHGPFDIIGDVHGCCDELEILLRELGYEIINERADDPVWGGGVYGHPLGRKAVFLGDLVDRGPRILDSLRLVRNMVMAGAALCVPGNHDIRLLRKLKGKNVQLTHGFDKTVAEVDALPEDFRIQFCEEAAAFIDGLVSHYLLDDGKLVVAHAGMKEEMQGRGSGKVRSFALYGDTTGETDEFGLPVRLNWALEYRGRALVIYGHTPVLEPEWLNRTVNIDTGCVFGGKLTALRYPEKEFVSIPAKKIYSEPARPFVTENRPLMTLQQQHDDLLDLDDVKGKRIISTRLRQNVIIREENATAALEVMSRFAVNPRWLIYLPPTMSPCGTSRKEGYLERPEEAFSYFRKVGLSQVICQEKHMGSRAVIIICRSREAAMRRFGVTDDGIGIIYTRTGRRFFEKRLIEAEFLEIIRNAMDKSDFWDEFKTTWACLDCELLPWSLKAKELLKTQYSATGASANAALAESVEALQKFCDRIERDSPGSPAPDEILTKYCDRRQLIADYIKAYRQYCWNVSSTGDLRLAPFHLLATEGMVHAGREHIWHMEKLARICESAPENLTRTQFRCVDINDQERLNDAIQWWESMTGKGGEGMVVKPADFVPRARGAQPAIKVRGRDYLRIIYGPEYTREENLDRLRSRNLGTKRSLALLEFALGVEALERFVRFESLRMVHECVFGILALESEPVDPRL